MLDSIKNPKDIHGFSVPQLEQLAAEIRTFLIDSISATGGHIGANLGVVELTLALHRVFDADADDILFDVGHQGYTHKILTGRKNLFASLNTYEGMSRFITPRESSYDVLDASHAGTAISIGTGLALARQNSGRPGLVVSVVGDGSLVEGMSFEGLNFAAERPLPLVLVINDNGMSIPPNVGGIRNLFAGEDWATKSEGFFGGMGFQYLPVMDGHDLEELTTVFGRAQKIVSAGPVVVHAKTEKGRGLEYAKDHPYKFHFSMPFDKETGGGSSPIPPGANYTAVVGDTLKDILEKDNHCYALTPATPYASGLDSLAPLFPDNVIDVGMAEQHAAGMAAGLAMAGKTVFACYQSTFLQRAMDQVFHDICFLDLPVTIISARSGFSGFDSPTHHALYDLPYLQALPNLQVFYAGTSRDLEAMIRLRAEKAKSPMVILHPYEGVWSGEKEHLPAKATPLSQPEVIAAGTDGVILTVGNRLPTAVRLRSELSKRFSADFGIVNIRWINPMPLEFLKDQLTRTPRVLTLEEGRSRGGFGSSVAQFLVETGLEADLHISAIRDEYVPAGDKIALSELTGIDSASILKVLKGKWFD
jgi:1-deoxy-D-xylulose-5-phosphate synthase